MITYHKLLNEGRDRLEKSGAGEQSALLYMNELCAKRDINLYMVMEEPVDENLQTDYLEGIHRMEKGEPLDYVLGYTPFYGYDIGVDSRVLIPRPETEELVALVLRLYDELFSPEKVTVFDVGTGSGAIALALALEEPNFTVYGSDISEDAVARASENKESLEAPVTFFSGDMLAPFIERGLRCQILVCNPPYIPDAETIESCVRDYEPNVALFGGPDGLKYYRQLFEGAGKVLVPGGFIAMEMGWNQAEAMTELARNHFPDAAFEVHQDINGKDRMFVIRTEGRNNDASEKRN